MPDWINDLLGPTGPQTKKLAYLLVVCCACMWLGYEVGTHGISAQWNVAFGMLTGFVTGGYLGGKAIEK